MITFLRIIIYELCSFEKTDWLKCNTTVDSEGTNYMKISLVVIIFNVDSMNN